jgi:hypothetical protein
VSLLDLSASALLDRLASTDPTPGGGSAAAWAGATGAALVEMVAGMEKTRSGDPRSGRASSRHGRVCTPRGSSCAGWWTRTRPPTTR